MAIFNRWGMKLDFKRPGTAADVRTLCHREADAHDLKRIAEGQYVIADCEDGETDLVDLALLKADGGFKEIEAASVAVCRESE